LMLRLKTFKRNKERKMRRKPQPKRKVSLMNPTPKTDNLA
jgi:hypothetical protein